MHYFLIQEIQPSRMTFIWELSSLEANGVITGFVIQYGPKSDPFIPKFSREFGPRERRGTLEGLIPGQR